MGQPCLATLDTAGNQHLLPLRFGRKEELTLTLTLTFKLVFHGAGDSRESSSSVSALSLPMSPAAPQAPMAPSSDKRKGLSLRARMQVWPSLTRAFRITFHWLADVYTTQPCYFWDYVALACSFVYDTALPNYRKKWCLATIIATVIIVAKTHALPSGMCNASQ